jgi:hypothetical protein
VGASGEGDNVKRFLALLAILWGGGAAVLLTTTWVFAYVNGGSFSVSLNSYCEAFPELILLTIVAPIFAVGLYYALEVYRNG